jgi:hypothetical protein
VGDLTKEDLEGKVVFVRADLNVSDDCWVQHGCWVLACACRRGLAGRLARIRLAQLESACVAA